MKNFFNKTIEKFNSLEIVVKKIMKNGIMFSFIVSVIATLILLTYEFSGNIYLYYIGLNIFQVSLFWAVEFVICGIAIDTIKKQLC